MTGINDNLNWNLAKRQQLTARTFPDKTSYIPSFSLLANSHIMMFGFRNDSAKSHWWLAADVYQNLLTLPSSTSEFQASVEAFRARCRLNTLTLIKFPDYGLLPFLVEIKFPRWHTQMYVEAWSYSGENNDQMIQSLSTISSHLTAIDVKLSQFSEP